MASSSLITAAAGSAPVQAPSLPHGRTAHRLSWPFLPPELRDAIEKRIGGEVVDAVSQDAGFTPGFASLLTATSGSTVFLKAANRKAQAPIAAAYAEEARKHALLAGRVPAPELLWTMDDRREDGWLVLCFEAYDGASPQRPWTDEDLDRALDLAEEIADRAADLPDALIAELRLDPLVEDIPDLVSSWSHVAAVFPERDHLEDADDLARAFAALPDRALVHGDLRDDNILLGTTGGAVACDWNWPALAPAWLDTVDLLVAAHGDGIDVEPLVGSRRLTRDVDPVQIDSWLAAYCGAMTVASTRAARSSSPFLPRHALWSAEASWSWLAARRGWPDRSI
jgi:aminoglycoside phosphotransferase (APT) family kinase protein